ncbi:ATP-binding protein [Corallococcus sp. Z5C101001]|uniref:ATP-binding protein n=1 Tax=Corallococcus sp. Z5C101001 TaxID=2596829 RepID=UPI00117E70B1|nr:ATP-binding protein [Corallococcus sp. Z5C101001]TSC20329.1 ATP-binding protein [Corallococcus sp. Z5C101001]
MTKVNEVFVAGGQPTVTYIARAHLKLTNAVSDYLNTLYKILSISGTTKSGKTVLVRSIASPENAIWLSGGNIDSIGSFWESIVEHLNAFSQTTETQSDTRSGTSSDEIDLAIKPAGMGLGKKLADGKSWANTDSTTRGRNVSAAVSGLRALMASKIPLVIDDFHYIDQATQGQIIKALKQPVFDGLPVILISVPHRAFDAVRVEREMTGRVQQLEVPIWSPTDLREIASAGFKALGISASDELTNRLTSECFQSPHLMQDFCGALCRENGLTISQSTPISLKPPASWEEFFKKQASGTAKTAFDQLKIGPRQRTDRIERKLRSGGTCDIYKAILLAIAQTGPKQTLSYEEIRTALKDILDGAPPQANEVTRVLDQMSTIARKDRSGEPVVDWDSQFSKLHVSDPFFAYYLKWGAQSQAD